MNKFCLKKSNEYNSSEYGEISSSYVVEKKSKFYSYIFYIETEAQAREKIDLLLNENPTARHLVYVYSYIDNGNRRVRFSDNGEPYKSATSGTLNYLDKENITNVCIITIRYFGGVLLGANLLTRTYTNVVKLATDNCIKTKLYNYEILEFCIEYKNYDKIMNILNKYILENLVIIDSINYDSNINVIIKVSKFHKTGVILKLNEYIIND